jgi:hypothetical protein
LTILYSKNFDEFVNKVSLYLHEFIRISNNDSINFNNLQINNSFLNLQINTKYKGEVNIDKIDFIWFNGGKIGFNDIQGKNLKLNQLLYQNYLLLFENFIKIECNEKLGILNNNLECNKIDVLLLAKKNGFFIPDTLFTKDRNELQKFIKTHEKAGVISKRIGEQTFFIEDTSVYNFANTFEITNTVLLKIPKKFGLTQFQEKIVKKFEIRVVYFNRQCYSMAIYSQEMDYRINLNSGKNIRMIPYKLSKIHEKMVINLMSQFNMSIGSLDFIMDLDDNLYLIEINQCGQIEFLNNHCNYYLDFDVASFIKRY